MADEAAPLRSDAERNRDRILAAARRRYATDGINVSMACLARDAGVGIATLFRRFPTRQDLVAAVFAETMDAYADATATALADPDPWHGFTGYLETVCAMQAADRGFAELLTMTFPTAKALEARRAEAYAGFTALIARAKAAGKLRPDFTPEDLGLLLMANAGVIAATRGAAPDAWRRLVGYMLQAFAVHDADALPPALDPTALFRAMVRLNRDARAGET
ncbi:helix-turn-helix domain-containing protein [Actinophytocola sp.]|jgi:AcrR family transcriptional regulator|uniref:TetR/AcrR family transcriptional regulator n=1 Tax=Actinophytocola sp. TaxID=1872138 RepID=UPI002ED968E8